MITRFLIITFATGFCAEAFFHQKQDEHNHSSQKYPIQFTERSVYGIMNISTGATQNNYSEVKLATRKFL